MRQARIRGVLWAGRLRFCVVPWQISGLVRLPASLPASAAAHHKDNAEWQRCCGANHEEIHHSPVHVTAARLICTATSERLEL